MINSRGVIYTTLGVYDTDSNRTTLYDRSTIVTSGGQTLTADTIFYDRLSSSAYTTNVSPCSMLTFPKASIEPLSE